MLITVVTPVYNEEKNINKCYKSLCEQTFNNFEWILIDDGSTDKSVELIEGIIQAHTKSSFSIRLLKQKNLGPSAARKLGIENAQGEFICPLDADDYLSSDFLALAMDKVSDNVDIVCTNTEKISPEGVVESRFQYYINTWPITGKMAFGECIDGWAIGKLIVRKTLYEKANLMLYSNSNATNNINDDDLIGRYYIYNARLIERCEGIYYYVSNPESITKKVNRDFHKFVYTAIKFYEFIQEKKYIDTKEYPDWNLKGQIHLLNNFNMVLYRYIKWRKIIDNTNEWKTSLSIICSYISLYKILINNKNTLNILKKKSLGYGYIIKSFIKVVFVRFALFIFK